MAIYPGGKNGSGVYQAIINLMPKHQIYVEAFLGGGAILRNKKPARFNFGFDLDDTVFGFFKDLKFDYLDLINDSFLNGLEKESDFSRVLKAEKIRNNEVLIYADPPYLKTVRKSKRPIYKYEFWTETEHEKLLTFIKSLPFNVMISGYDSPLYNEMLSTWRKASFNTTNRAGQKTTEIVWLNFPEPFELHDYSFLGDDFRERERIHKKRKRLKKRLLEMDKYERLALIATVEEIKTLQLTSTF
ncbi:MAG TPA: DNA adenine methylase [Pyrinomonadaceae bacterium]|jgi:site-specific DNA-adenine methylase